MKKSGNLLTGVLVVLGLIVGFFIGVLINWPPTDESRLSGTIGKVDNYRNVKVSENDINLRSELMNNKQMLSDFQRYYSFHYTNNVHKGEIISESLAAFRNVEEFAGPNQEKINALDQYNKFIAEARKDILIALMALRKIADGSGEQSIGVPLNNANNAVAQISYKGKAILDIVEALDDFLKERKSGSFPELTKAHDRLLLCQVQTSVATNDKLMMKYLDKKEFFGSKEDIGLCSVVTQDQVNNSVSSDIAGLVTSSNVVGSAVTYDSQNVQDIVVSDVYNDIFNDIVTIGVTFDAVQNSNCIFDVSNFSGSNVIGLVTSSGPDVYGITVPQ
jgi:hypothetical protein